MGAPVDGEQLDLVGGSERDADVTELMDEDE